MSLSAGSRLGPYEVLSPLGAGGMGEVYRARDSRLRREVALKILPAEVAADPSRRARFEQEAHAAAALNHPNILAVFDVGGDGDATYLATELVNGDTLAAVIERGPLPVRTLLDLAVQMADGLAAAHAAHIVHRDLKPANVMVTGDGRVKILDFGLAKQGVAATDGETIAAHQTLPGMIVGTVHYMSPEQARGKAVDVRSDQFSFGLMLYEMASGKKAFDEAESVQTLSAIIAKDPPPLDARLPAPLRWVIDRCLAKSPESRYDSTRDLFHELRSLRDHLSEISTQIQQPAVAPVVVKRSHLWGVAAAFLLGVAVPIAWAVALVGPAPPDPTNYRFTPMAFEPGGQSSVVFSGDGKAVAYAARPASSTPYQVHVRYLDQPTALQLTELKESAYPIAWSPDNSRVLFATQAPAIWSIPTAGGEPQRLLSLPGSSAEAVPLGITVSADNTVAAFLSRADDGMWGVSTASLPDGQPVRYPVEPFATRDIYNTPNLKFSPDGRQLLLVLNRAIAGEEAWIVRYPAEGASGVRRIEPPLTTHAGAQGVAWMPDSRRVVITLKPRPLGAQQLWFLDTQSGARQAITTGTRDAALPAIAPSGDRLVFRESSSDFDVVSVDIATGAATVLIATERHEQMPQWSAGEPSLVYTTNRNGLPEIWLRRGGVPDAPLVTAQSFPPDSTSFFVLPTLSPRGDRVIYTRVETDGPAWLWISAVGGGAPIRASNETADGRVEFPGAWSPDGAWFTYFASVGGKPQLMKIRTRGQAAPELIKADVPFTGALGMPDWSPTGEWIVAAETLISPDGKIERPLGSHGSSHYVFSKDGRLLYGLRSENGRQVLFSIDVATGTVRTIGSANTYPPMGTLNPSIRFSVGPDGKSLVYSTGQIRTGLWLLEGFNPPDGFAARLGWR